MHDGGLVRPEVVQADERAGTVAWRRSKDLLHEGVEDRGVGRGGDAHGRDQPAEPERADQGEPTPAAERHRASGPLAAPGPGEAPGHARVDTALVDEDQASRVEAASSDLLAPCGTLLSHAAPRSPSTISLPSPPAPLSDGSAGAFLPPAGSQELPSASVRHRTRGPSPSLQAAAPGIELWASPVPPPRPRRASPPDQ